MPSFVASQQISTGSMVRFWENRNSTLVHSPVTVGVEINLEHIVHTDVDQNHSIRGTDSFPAKDDADDLLETPVEVLSKDGLAEAV